MTRDRGVVHHSKRVRIDCRLYWWSSIFSPSSWLTRWSWFCDIHSQHFPLD